MKAYTVKIVLRWLNHEANKHSRRQVRAVGQDAAHEASLLASCTFAFNEFVHVMDENGPHLHVSAKQRGKTMGTFFLQLYQLLASRAVGRGRALFKIRPKTHYLSHLVYDVLPKFNPRRRANRMDEDFMGKATKVASLCHPRMVPLRSFQRMQLQYADTWSKTAVLLTASV